MNGQAVGAAPVAGAAASDLAPVRPVRPARAIAERSASVPADERVSRAFKP